MEAVLYYEQMSIASDAADAQHAQNRQQQVALRLQENQGELVRMHQLRRILSEQQVQLGVRNIDSRSGTVRAITEQNLQAYIQDENADKLNFNAKMQNLNIQNRMIDINKRAQYIQATAAFMKEIEGAVSAGAGAGGGAGGMGGARASGGAMAGSGGSSNMFDNANGYNMNLNG